MDKPIKAKPKTNTNSDAILLIELKYIICSHECQKKNSELSSAKASILCELL